LFVSTSVIPVSAYANPVKLFNPVDPTIVPTPVETSIVNKSHICEPIPFMPYKVPFSSKAKSFVVALNPVCPTKVVSPLLRSILYILSFGNPNALLIVPHNSFVTGLKVIACISM